MLLHAPNQQFNQPFVYKRAVGQRMQRFCSVRRGISFANAAFRFLKMVVAAGEGAKMPPGTPGVTVT
jgi:hypothetical protein